MFTFPKKNLYAGLLGIFCFQSLLFSTLFFTVSIVCSQPFESQKKAHEAPAVPAIDDSLPPVPAQTENAASPPAAASVYVQRFNIIGNTVFSSEEISAITKAYENRTISSEELQEVRHRISLLYVNRGYINSGAVIPDQEVRDGTVTLKIIEGRLTDIEINGTERLIPEYISRRIAMSATPPLDINRLQERIQLLHANPLIRRIQAELGPGIRPGEGVLKVNVTEERPWLMSFFFDNHRSPTVGALQSGIHVAHLNVSGRGDRLGAKFNVTEGTDGYAGYYRLPVNARDTSIELYFEKNDASVVEAPFDKVGINSKSLTYGLTVIHPLLRRQGQDLTIGLTAEKRHSKTWVLGEPFSFSPGVQNGESDVTVIRLIQQWIDRRPEQVLAARSVFSIGIDALGATDNGDDPDGQFFTWLGQFQYARRFPRHRDCQVIFRTDFQLAERSLLPIEQFPLGGATSVRGYRETQLLRDNGMFASAELRVPLLRLPVPKISKTSQDGMLQLAPFCDFGWGWHTDLSTPDPKTIASAGLGIRWDPAEKIHAEIYCGYPLRDPDNSGSDLQDMGIHFQFNWQIF